MASPISTVCSSRRLWGRLKSWDTEGDWNPSLYDFPFTTYLSYFCGCYPPPELHTTSFVLLYCKANSAANSLIASWGRTSNCQWFSQSWPLQNAWSKRTESIGCLVLTITNFLRQHQRSRYAACFNISSWNSKWVTNCNCLSTRKIMKTENHYIFWGPLSRSLKACKLPIAC